MGRQSLDRGVSVTNAVEPKPVAQGPFSSFTCYLLVAHKAHLCPRALHTPRKCPLLCSKKGARMNTDDKEGAPKLSSFPGWHHTKQRHNKAVLGQPFVLSLLLWRSLRFARSLAFQCPLTQKGISHTQNSFYTGDWHVHFYTGISQETVVIILRLSFLMLCVCSLCSFPRCEKTCTWRVNGVNK